MKKQSKILDKAVEIASLLEGNKYKLCACCKRNKLLSNFGIRNVSKDRLHVYCNDCQKLKRKEYLKNNPWNTSYKGANERCTNPNNSHYKYYGAKGIKFLLTKEEIKELWFRDKACKMVRPSIDRKDNDGNYEYGNCRFIEFSENVIKRNLSYGKPILQYDLDGNFIRKWKSATEAGKILNICNSSIGAVCKQKHKQAKGYIFKYEK